MVIEPHGTGQVPPSMQLYEGRIASMERLIAPWGPPPGAPPCPQLGHSCILFRVSIVWHMSFSFRDEGV